MNVTTSPCLKLRPVDLSGCSIAGVEFFDTGGTNGYLAAELPAWVAPVVESLKLDGMVSHIALRLLPAGQGIPPHIDPKPHRARLRERRFHVPIVTHADVRMRWPELGVDEHLEAGWLYEVDHFALHEVVQSAPVGRVHLCIDTIERAA